MATVVAMIATIVTVVGCMCVAFYCGMIHERQKWVDAIVNHARRIGAISDDHRRAIEELKR